MSCVPGSSNLDSFRDERQVAVQLVPSGVLPPGLVRQQNTLLLILIFHMNFTESFTTLGRLIRYTELVNEQIIENCLTLSYFSWIIWHSHYVLFEIKHVTLLKNELISMIKKVDSWKNFQNCIVISISSIWKVELYECSINLHTVKLHVPPLWEYVFPQGENINIILKYYK